MPDGSAPEKASKRRWRWPLSSRSPNQITTWKAQLKNAVANTFRPTAPQLPNR